MKDHVPRDDIFSGKREQMFLLWYRRVFSIAEIERQVILQWFFGATLFSFLITFNSWIGSPAVTRHWYTIIEHVCWPWFLTCGEHYVLETLPHGYSQGLLYMVMMGLMLLTAYLMYTRDWVLAHICMLLMFMWKFLMVFVFTAQLAGNYEYYHLALTAVLLFFPYKLFFLKLVFVLLYSLSATAKIHETWITGSYFSSLQTGLPLFPEWSIPFWTNAVMIMQIVGAWFLLGSNMYLQRAVFIYFLIFHLYSGILVEYRYPLTVLPSLVILFGLWYSPTRVPLTVSAIPGWTFVLVLVLLQSVSILIPGDERLTGEGNKMGLYMFEANHQCVSEATVYKNDGTHMEIDRQSALARNRCEPYKFWFQLQEVCRRHAAEIESIQWTFDHSVNGGPFYRIVSVDDVCAVEYRVLQHNAWIRTPESGAEKRGYPVQNFYY